MEPIIKARKRGDIVPFSSLHTTGEIIELPNCEGQQWIVNNNNYHKGDFTKYTPYIPLVYVMAVFNNDKLNPITNHGAYLNIIFGKDRAIKDWNETYKDKLTNHPARHLVWRSYSYRESSKLGPEAIKEGFLNYLKNYLEFDTSIPLDHLRYNSYNSKEEVTRGFKGNSYYPYTANSFRFKTYNGHVGPYSLWIKSDRGQHDPHIISVIRAEDWAYQRLYVLKHGKPDISKVFILVDNRIDGTFPYQAFKGYYKEQLLPELKKLSCPVFKVPHEFIIQNCYIQDFQLKEKNILKRKQEVEGLIDGFYEKYGDRPRKVEKIFVDEASQQEAEVWASTIVDALDPIPLSVTELERYVHAYEAQRRVMSEMTGIPENMQGATNGSAQAQHVSDIYGPRWTVRNRPLSPNESYPSYVAGIDPFHVEPINPNDPLP
jgi:hypothetical protein